MPYVKTRDGVDIYYETFGEGRPFLFLHTRFRRRRRFYTEPEKVHGIMRDFLKSK